MHIPYVYKIGWTQKDTWYCGSESKKKAHPSNLWKTYFTSSKHVKKFREANGEPDHLEILKEFENAEEALSYEEQKLIEYDVLNKTNWLNRHIGGSKFKGREVGCSISKEHKRKLSIAAKNRKPMSDETKEKLSKTQKGRKRKPFSKEHRSKIGKAHKGKITSEETRIKMSNSHKGLKISEEHKQRISLSNTNRKGEKRSEETRRKMSESAKNRKLKSLQ